MPQAHVLLLGDSLRMAYQSRVSELLAEDGMTCAWPATSCGNSHACLEGAEGWLREHEPDIVTFGCGPHAAEDSHSIVIEGGREPCSLSDFESDLVHLAQLLRRCCGRQVVYVTTPRLHVGRFDRSHDLRGGRTAGEMKGRDLAESLNSCIDQYNEMGALLMGEFNIMVADLNHDLAPFMDECIEANGCSLTAAGIERAARTVVQGILRVL